MGVKGNAFSGPATTSISQDGRYVAFTSNATNLDGADADGLADVYVRDLQNGTTVLVSRADGPAGADANLVSLDPSISADGRYVAFTSFASNLTTDDPDIRNDVFVRDLQAGTTKLVSRADGPNGANAENSAGRPSISADGRYVAFDSFATNLDPDDTDSIVDVFVRDLQLNTTRLVSRADTAGGAKGDATSWFPLISGDGRSVTYSSFATNLDGDDADATQDVYVRDLQADATTLASRSDGAGGAKGNGASILPSISANGRFVAFASEATNLDAADPDTTRDVLVRDLQSNLTTLVSRAEGAGGVKGNGESHFPAISADGRLVAFHSQASNLTVDDPDSVLDVLVRDLQGATTVLASRANGPFGAKGNGASRTPAISADGRVVAFGSEATNLDPDDSDSISDAFARELLPGLADCTIDRRDARNAQIIEGTSGDDVICGSRFGDVIRGRGGDDVVYGLGGADAIEGNDGDDVLLGGEGADGLKGNAGDDTLVGGAGNDNLDGGAGQDTEIQN